MPQRPGALVAVSTVVALLLAGSGCSADEPAEEPAAKPPSVSASVSASATDLPSSAGPSAEPSAAEPTSGGPSTTTPGDSAGTAPPAPASSAAGGGAAAGLATRLLPASDLPGFNSTFRWRERGTSPREPGRLATCHRFAIASLGATRTLTRTYAPAGQAGPPARHLVAQFPDEATAARAYAVLGAWRRQCSDRLSGYELRRLGPLTAVSVPSGTAGWYLLTYGPVRQGSDDAVFESTGIAIAGSRVAVVDLRLVGQDFNYAVGREPMVTAVQRAAALLS